MARPTDPSRTRDEIERIFRENFQGLVLSGRGYDEGYFGEAARLAVIVYTFVHDYGKSTKSILTQLNLKSMKFLNTAKQINPNNLAAEMPLVVVGMGASEMKYLPMLDDAPPGAPQENVDFSVWWERHVLRDNRRRLMSRKNIVFHLRNNAGGGHLDGRIEEAFADMNRSNSMGWVGLSGTKTFIPEYGPQYATMRQISWELEHSLRTACPDLSS